MFERLYYLQNVGLCPEIARYYGNRAACYMMIGRYKDALNDAKKCVEMDPTFIKVSIRSETRKYH